MHGEENSGRSSVAPGARFSLALLLAINLFNYIDRYVLAALEPNIGREFFPGKANDAITMAKTGSLASAFLITYMIAAPLLGWLADRMSRWILIGVSVGIWSLATGASGMASTFTLLMLTRCFVGIGEAGYGPAAPTIISDLYPVSRRGAVLAWFFMAIPVGSALGYVIGSLLGAKFGWRVAFLAVMPPGLILAAICFFVTDPRKNVKRAHANSLTDPPRGQSRMQEYLALLNNRSFVLDTLGMAAMTFAIGGMSFWMPRYLCEPISTGCRGLPESAKAIFGGITAGAGLLATLLGGLVGDRLRDRFSGSYFLVSGVAMFVAAPFLALVLILPFPWAWIPLTGSIFFLFFNTGPSNTILANVTHPTVRASAFALNIVVVHLLGDVPASPLLGGVAGRFGWSAAFGIVIVAMAISGTLWLIGMSSLKRDTDVVELAIASTKPLPPV